MPRSFVAAVAVTLSLGQADAREFALSSPDVGKDGVIKAAQVFKGFGCEGGNVSPELTWTDPPAGTRSYVVTMYDPDAPTGSGWWHWILFDIPAEVTHLAPGAGTQGKGPAGSAHGRTDFGAEAYGGPCPPAGDKPHRYVFTVYALRAAKLFEGWAGAPPSSPSGAMVGCALLGPQVLAKATFTARYGR